MSLRTVAFLRLITVIGAVMFAASVSLAQNTFPASGNVGIGTTTPQSLLHINSAGGAEERVDAVRAQAGLGASGFTDAAASGVLVKAVHINELRNALDAAMGPLGFATGGWTDTLSTGVAIKAVHFQEIRNRVK